MRYLSAEEVAAECRRGQKWIIVDNSVLDVSSLVSGDAQAAHKGGNVFSLGRDNTHLFRELHANLPKMPSKHRPGFSITAHIQQKVQSTFVGMLSSCRGEVPLNDPEHEFWAPSARKPPYTERVTSSMAARGLDAAAEVREAVAGFAEGSPEYRAFWAVVGTLVADAAAQPTHWNYKVTYYHEALRSLGRWEEPEFVVPSLNAYYRVPLGSQSCFGDQAACVLRSLVRCGGVDPHDVVQEHIHTFGLDGEYGPELNPNGAAGGELPIEGPWRHGSIAGFLQNVSAGRGWPRCGTRDGSSDCFVKIVPVVALYAGREDMLEHVEDVVRVTQNNSTTVAYAVAAARILERIILEGSCGEEAIRHAIAAMRRLRWQHDAGTVARQMESTMQFSEAPFLEGVLGYCGGQYNAVEVS